MAQAIDEILKELDAGYNPSRDLINKRLAAVPGEAEAQIAGLDAKKTAAFDSITAGARNRGMGFSGIPLEEQAKYSATDYMPAVAGVRKSQNEVTNNLTDALNNINLDQRKTAYQIRDNQVAQDIAREQQAAQERAARAAAAASSGWMSGLMGGGADPGVSSQAPAQADPYAKVDRNGAANAIRALLNSGNVATISATVKAITDSANRGNLYDKYKLELLKAAQTPSNNSAFDPKYANLLKQAASYKPAAAKASNQIKLPMYSTSGFPVRMK